MANNTIIETLATTSVKKHLLMTKLVDISYIKEGDKEPLIDGNLYIYRDENHWDNEHLHCILTTQIKGTEAKIENSLKYNIKVIDLKQYRRIGSILYFVVQVDKDNSENNKIFYVALHPFKIDNILKKSKPKQGKISVEVDEFPKDKDTIISLLYTFEYNQQKQKPYFELTDKTPSLDINKIYIPVCTPFPSIDPNKILLSIDNIAYAKLSNGQEYPVKEIKHENFSTRFSHNEPVSANNRVYFKSYDVIKSHNSFSLIFANNVEFAFNPQTLESQECHLEFQGTLDNHILCNEFLLDVARNHGFYIGNNKYSLTFAPQAIPQLENNLTYYNKLNQALKICGCNNDLYIREFTNEDTNIANLLIATFVEKKDIDLNATQEGCILNLKLCNFSIICLAIRQKNGKYKFIPFPFNGVASIEINNERVDVSTYVMLKSEYLQNSLNIDLSDSIVKVKQQNITKASLAQTNTYALELIKVYDSTKKYEFLDTAYEIIKWIEQNNMDEHSAVLYHLNALQCKKRENNELSEIDKNYLFDITDSNQDDFLKCGAAILLGEKERAERIFNRLDEAQKTRIKDFPIYNLWKDLNNG